GRSNLTQTKAPSPSQYVKNIIKGFELAENLGIIINHQDLSLDLKKSYCGANGTNLILTSDGYISSCSEITESSHPDSSTFIYGKIEGQKLKINENKLHILKKRTVDNVIGCNHCFARYICAGKCFIRSLNNTQSIFIADKSTCTIQQELLKYLLARLLRGNINMESYDFLTKVVKFKTNA
ncbi:MAG: SPASM domain-containing protein, partial [Methanobacteriota archaeon]